MTDNQPVDNELDEILDELNIEYNEYRGEMYHIDPLKYEKKIRPIAKARLLQWGTEQYKKGYIDGGIKEITR